MKKRYCKFCGNETDTPRCEICGRRTVASLTHASDMVHAKKEQITKSDSFPYMSSGSSQHVSKRQHPYRKNSENIKKDLRKTLLEIREDISVKQSKKKTAAKESIGKQVLQLAAVGVVITCSVLIPFIGEIRDEDSSYQEDASFEASLLPVEEDAGLSLWIEQEGAAAYLYLENDTSFYVDGMFDEDVSFAHLPQSELVYPYSQMRWQLPENAAYDIAQFPFSQVSAYEVNREEEEPSYMLYRQIKENGKEEIALMLKESAEEEALEHLLFTLMDGCAYDEMSGMQRWKICLDDVQQQIGYADVDLDDRSYSLTLEEL